MCDDVENPKAKGGLARAKSLTPEERREIARKAALARWDEKIPTATHEGNFNIGSLTISAAVLPQGKRVITQATLLRALGRSRSPKAGTGVLSTVDGLPFFLQADVLKAFISKELMMSTTPVFYRTKNGGRGVGYDAELLPHVCEVYLRFRDDCLQRQDRRNEERRVPSQYAHIVTACDTLMRGLAHVGIAALIDEATGYQEVRDRNALQAILDKYLTEEKAKWAKTFPDDFYRKLFRLKGWSFNPLSVKRPSVIGHYTNDIVYERIAPGILKKLQELNPRNDDGHRKHKHFQFFTDDYGLPELKTHILNVMFLMDAAGDDWELFKSLLGRAAPKKGETLPLNITSIDC